MRGEEKLTVYGAENREEDSDLTIEALRKAIIREEGSDLSMDFDKIDTFVFRDFRKNILFSGSDFQELYTWFFFFWVQIILSDLKVIINY